MDQQIEEVNTAEPQPQQPTEELQQEGAARPENYKPRLTLEWDNDAQAVAIQVSNCRTFDIQLMVLDCARRVIEDAMAVARNAVRHQQAMQHAQSQAIAAQLAGKQVGPQGLMRGRH